MMENKFSLIGLLGGTFDPIHNGHLAIVKHLLNQFEFTEIQLLPCAQSPLRESPMASEEQRIRMIQLAIADHAKLKLNTLEIYRGGISYMINTLEELYGLYSHSALVLIIGADVLLQFNRWHRWQEILDRAHLMVINRPKFNIDLEIDQSDPLLKTWLHQHQCSDFKEFTSKRNGYIFFESMPEKNISSSSIREKIRRGEFFQSDLPSPISDYIKKNNIYSIKS